MSIATINQFNLITGAPADLSGSVSNPIVLGHRIPYNFIDINNQYGCDSDCHITGMAIVSTSGDVTHDVANNILTIRLEKEFTSSDKGTNISGVTTVSFTSSDVTPGSCTGAPSNYDNLDISDTISISSTSLSSFVTGVGLEIPFSGGSGNVELSYFEPLTTGTVILVPQATGQLLSSQEDYFYIYTTGNAQYSGIKHPTQTGIKEVVGGSNDWSASANNKIVCRYASDLTSLFIYDTSTQTWSTSNPFGASAITRVLKLDHNDGLYLVLGAATGEHVIYDSDVNSSHSITDNATGTPRLLPQNIAVIPDNQLNSCTFNVTDSENMLFYNGNYHIFAVDHDYSGNTVYPITLQSVTGSTSLENGDFTLSGNLASGTTYLSSYLNYRPDVITVADRLVIALTSTGNNNSEMIIWNNSTLQTDTIYSSEKRKRMVKLSNDQVLWCSATNTGTSTVIDPFEVLEYSFPVALTGNISVAASCPIEYRTLMLDADGESAYIINDLDRQYDTFSFTGSLPMGKYHDVFVFNALTYSSYQSHNFYLMPDEIYSSTFPESNLIALSTSTSSATGVVFTGSFEINETVVSFDPTQTTTGLTEIGRFFVSGGEDEFVGTYNVAINTGVEDSEIYDLTFSGISGIVYVKSGVYFDYETKPFYYGYVTGVDSYVNQEPFINGNFRLDILDVGEAPTGIVFDFPNSGGYNANNPVDEDKLVGTFTVLDPDSTSNTNYIGVSGADASIFNVNFDTSTQAGSIFVKSGTVFDIGVKDLYQLTLYAGISGSAFTTSGDWTLYLTDNAPVSVSVIPTGTGLLETYVPPSTGLLLAEFTVVDDDTNRDNFASLIGSDASYFSLDYDFSVSNVGTLRLQSSAAFDYETKQKVTGTIAVGNINGEYSATANYIISVEDVDFELTGVGLNPSIYNIDDGTVFGANTVVADLVWTDVDLLANPGADMVVYDIRYAGGSFGSALDKFGVLNNTSRYPSLVVKEGTIIDITEQSRYDLVIYARPDFGNQELGGTFTLVVNPINRAPIVTFDPTGFTILESTPTSAGAFKVCDIIVKDEELSTVNFALSGADSSFFTMNISTGIVDSYTGEVVGNLFFNSGVSLNVDSKDSYTGAVYATDSSGLIGSGNFVLNITDEPFCEYSLTTITKTDNVCKNSDDGRIVIDFAYTGADSVICGSNTLFVEWLNLPSGVSGLYNGRVVSSLTDGSYTGVLYAGDVPLQYLSYVISSESDLSFLQSTKSHNICLPTGSLNVLWTGGVPPYTINYGSSFGFVPSGSGFSTSLTIYESVLSGIPTVTDARGCKALGYPVSFSMPSNAFVRYDGQTPPIIYDDAAQSFRLHTSNNEGPHRLDIYYTTTGEQGELFRSFDRFETDILDSIDKTTNIYYYDLKNIMYPGRYVFKFTNINECEIVSAPLQVLNIAPLQTDLTIQHDYSSDLGAHTVTQPVLETLFIPYEMIINNSDLLSYISNTTEKTDIKLEIDGVIYTRKILNGSINCDDYAILNIKFLGINSNDWYYTLNFFQGFDLTNTEVDILNANIYLILPNDDKIKVVTELNNNTNTIKLLRGSLLTTNTNRSQYAIDREIGLFSYNPTSARYETLDVQARVSDMSVLSNKYISGNITRVSFLEDPRISDNLRSDSLTSVSFDCNSSQRSILNARKFLLVLNSFGLSNNVFSKVINYYQHNSAISNNVTGGYTNYSIFYSYYDPVKKCLSSLKRNNEIVTDFEVNSVPAGSYVIKIRDAYGNKLQFVNALPYSTVYEKALDYILNELDVTPEVLDFEYGDLLVNIIDTRTQTIPGDGGLPGQTVDPPTVVNPPARNPSVTTSTYALTNNSLYKNSIIIQTSPLKVPFIVTGPNGYRKKFYDRSILTQMPPGVYNIEQDSQDLTSRYLYPQKRSIAINNTTNIFIGIKFDSYVDRVVIDDSSCTLE